MNTTRKYIVDSQDLYVSPTSPNYFLTFGQRMLDFVNVITDWCTFDDGVEIQGEMIPVLDLKEEIESFVEKVR